MNTFFIPAIRFSQYEYCSYYEDYSSYNVLFILSNLFFNFFKKIIPCGYGRASAAKSAKSGVFHRKPGPVRLILTEFRAFCRAPDRAFLPAILGRVSMTFLLHARLPEMTLQLRLSAPGIHTVNRPAIWPAGKPFLDHFLTMAVNGAPRDSSRRCSAWRRAFFPV
jgi:hypothetical protein